MTNEDGVKKFYNDAKIFRRVFSKWYFCDVYHLEVKFDYQEVSIQTRRMVKDLGELLNIRIFTASPVLGDRAAYLQLRTMIPKGVVKLELRDCQWTVSFWCYLKRLTMEFCRMKSTLEV